MQQQQLLETRYLPSNYKNPDFWEKHYNYDYPRNPTGEFNAFRFNTTLYLNPTLFNDIGIFENVKKQIETVEKPTNNIQDFKKCEVWLDVKNYVNGGVGISIDFCAGDEVTNKLRGDKIKYKERWTLEIHIRLGNPNHTTQPKRDDAVTDFNVIKNQDSLLEKIKILLSEFDNSIQQNLVFLKDLNKENCNNCEYKFEDTQAKNNRPQAPAKKQSAPQTVAPNSSQFKKGLEKNVPQKSKGKDKGKDSDNEDTDINDDEMASYMATFQKKKS